MYKTLGGYNWSGLFFEPAAGDECPLSMPEEIQNVPIMDSEESIKYSAQQFHLALESMKSVTNSCIELNI